MNNAANTPLNVFNTFFGNSDAGAEAQQRINDLIPSIIYIYDVNSKKLSYVNKKMTDILGYTLDDITGLDTIVHKDEAASIVNTIEKLQALKDTEHHTYNNRLNHKDGQWKYFRTTGSVLHRNDKGEATSFLFIAEDITGTLETEAEIKVKKDLIIETEELLQFGTWSWDAVNNKMEWSDGLYNLIGQTREEAGTGIDYYLQFIKRQDMEAMVEKVKTAIANNTSFEHTYNLTTKKGEQKIVTTRGKVLLSVNGELLKIFGTSRDVTEQVSAYRELLNYKQMTLEKELFLQSGSWEIDLATGKIYWSDGMYGLFEYDVTDGEMPELTADLYFSHFSDAEIQEIKKDWQVLLDGGENYARQETITAKNGEKKRLETYGKAIRNSDGVAIKVMGATKDVSRLKEYERKLEKKVQELERSNKELEEFAYVASHDLQEPLRKISTFSERLKLKFENQLGEDGKGYINRMLNAAANMRMLIENLLNFSRLTVKKVEYVKTGMNALLDEVLTEIELQVDESHATIKHDKLPELEVIPSQVKQLFSNIILNAIKFRKQDTDPVIEIKSVQLTAAEKEKYYLQPDAVYYAISISDNGIGFEQEYAEKIFQIFQRLHGKSEYPGAGIGLAICKKIVDNHHGKLFASSKPGEGATFTAILPEKNN